MVTCICPTMYSRLEWLPQAIRSFREQTWPTEDRELLFVADGDWIESVIPSGLNCRWLKAEHLNVGTRRNLACEAARGEIICHWDDDDFSFPDRIADQVGRLEATGKAVTGYTSAAFFDGTNWYRYLGVATMVIGTSLCYRREFWKKNPFPAQQVGEDSSFVGTALCASQLASSPDAGLIQCSMHLGNTSPRQIETKTWALMPERATLPFGRFAPINI